MDPHGYLLADENDVYRVIRAQSRAFYDKLLAGDVVETLQRRERLVASEISERKDPDSEGALVVRHPKLSPVTYASEWTPSALKDAAILTLELCLELAAKNLTLQDATPWNVLFPSHAPIFVDLTSIVGEDLGVIWKAQSQFEELFWRPLVLCSEKKGAAARALLCNPIAGVDETSFQNLISLRYHLRHPQQAMLTAISRRIQTNDAMRARLMQSVRAPRAEISTALRKTFFSRLLAKVRSLEFPGGTDVWKDYYGSIPSTVDTQHKLDLIEQIVRSRRPQSVVDIGANTGVFSARAAQAGARVIAVDSSQSCTENIYALARREKLPITTVLSDIVGPLQPQGMIPNDYPDLCVRLRSDMVLCLGLMHHLLITGRQPFERIALLLDRLAKKTAVIEYIAPEDENVARLNILKPPSYALDDLLAPIRWWFPTIAVVDSDRPTRKVITCDR